MPKKKTVYAWEKDPYAKTWVDGLAESSLDLYKGRFNDWCIFIGVTPKEQIDKRILDLQSSNPKERNYFEDKVIEYKNRLETQGYMGKTLLGKLTPIRSFFTANRVQLHFKRGELRGKKPHEKQILKFAPNNEEIRAMHQIASVRDRAILTFLYQTGFSPVDVLKRNIGDIIDAFKNEDRHFVVETHRQKTGSPHVTCLSYEGVYDIKSMLKDRGINVNEVLGNPDHPLRNEPLFVTEKDKRLTGRFVNEAMKKLAKKAMAKERAEQFTTKSLRDAYNCALLQANLTQEIKDILFGHKREGARGNYAFSEEIIRQAYVKVFPKLSINGHRQTKKAIEELENRFDTTIESMSETITNQKQQIDELKEQVTDLRFTMQPYIEEMSKIKKIRELVEKQKKEKS